MSIPIENIHPCGTDYAPHRSHVFVAVRRDNVASAGYAGLFAGQDITRGTVVATDGGVVLTSVQGLPHQYAALIGPKRFLAPPNYDSLDDLCFLNHSCDSNLARIGGLVYLAKKDIHEGSQLTIDYAPLVAGIDRWRMTCLCGTTCCRKIITGEDWLNPVIADRLWEEWLPHTQKRILRKRGFNVLDGTASSVHIPPSNPS